MRRLDRILDRDDRLPIRAWRRRLAHRVCRLSISDRLGAIGRRRLTQAAGLPVACLLVAAAAVAPVLAEGPAQVVFLVRHAEPLYPPPVADPRDPPLNLLGQNRADQLARLLSPQEVDAVFSTDYQRTQETAAPTAARFGLSVTSYDPRQLERFAERLWQRSGVSLVVGHSNTTPQLVEHLGGEPGEPIAEQSEFDRLYVLTRTGSQVSTLVLRYGDPLPENWRELADSRRVD